MLLIGAYRDNEVTSAHPLMRTLDRIRAAGAPVQDIVLAPLAHEHVGQLIADSLYCDRERAAPLAELVHEKTAGNPFFVIQFLSALVEEGLLTFDHGAARWFWDLARIHAKGYTDNVVDLMVGKLSRLPISTRKFLQQLACLGNSAEFALAGNGPRGFERGTAQRSAGSAANRTRSPVRRFLSFPSRPRSGSRVLTDPGSTARRGSSPNREAAGARTLRPKSARKRSSKSSINSTAALP